MQRDVPSEPVRMRLSQNCSTLDNGLLTHKAGIGGIDVAVMTQAIAHCDMAALLQSVSRHRHIFVREFGRGYAPAEVVVSNMLVQRI